MSRSFDFQVNYATSSKAVHDALIDEKLWRARFKESERATLDVSHPNGAGTAVVAMSERIGDNKIPTLVRKVLKGELTLSRTDDWGPSEDGIARGTFTGGSTGITGNFSGTYVLRPAADGSVLEVSGEVTVKVRLVGGAIESLAEQLLVKLLNSERKHTEQWLAAQAGN